MSTVARRRTRRLGAVAAAVVAALTGLGVAAPAHADLLPPPPRSDPFYDPPADFADTTPGTVLRSRPVQLGISVAATAWQLLYRTTDLDGRPDATVTTVLLPAGAREDRPLAAFQAYENSSAPDCVTSYQLELPDLPINAATMQRPDIAELLQRGWAVSIADFEGRRGHFAVADEPGYLILDGIRAAEHFGPLGLNAHTRVGLYGNSGGGLATGWAAEVQPRYAPELNLAGASIGTPVPAPSDSIRKSNGTVSAGLGGDLFASLATAYPEFGDAVRAHMSPEGLAALDTVRAQCVIANNFRFMFTDWQRYLDLPLDQFLALPPVSDVLRRVSLGGHAPTAPIFLYQDVHDEIISVGSTDALAEKYCAAGTSVDYVRDLTADHTSIGDAGRPAAIGWLAQRLDAGAPAPSGCATRDVRSVSELDGSN
ncbi:lipase family protein [Nocardia sp. CDC159]|uniref:Lipase family protein n=1 Tax=Nocardia pulmonis TaxID=2951408 RepID=A0A9X2IYS5_9NOCA|nr:MULTISPECIES: lipase family protein [Nocardia]MCM6777352.1 lipase family protein [Nocardia pulmonis]MCM6790237.1 lipase family protein [Nocardia sp. CDC159]